MSDNKITKTFIDPKTGETESLQFKKQINGWIHDEEKTDAAIVWKSPENESVYIGFDRTGVHTWSAWLDIPEETRRNTGFHSLSSPENALQKAEEIMEKYT